jgi:hypothetical protein
MTETILKKAYAAFNQRDIEGLFQLMSEDITWPKASEEGRATGKEEIRAYWTRQWSQFNPQVEPIEIHEPKDNKTEVRVHQLVKSLEGETLSDSEVTHTFTITKGLITSMEIKPTTESAAAFQTQK